MANGPFFIDYEAFQHGSGHAIIKELTFMESNRPLSPLHYVFSPPCNWYELDKDEQKTYKWLTKKYHRLAWEEGDRLFCTECITRHIKLNFPAWDVGIWYVLEAEANGPKVTLLKSLFPMLNIVNYNVAFANLPSIPHNITCPYRNHDMHCSFLKCLRMCQHYAELPY